MKRLLIVAIPLFLSASSRAQWMPASGPDMQYITVFASQGSNWVCGTALGDVFRSTDRGATWGNTHAGLNSHSITAIATHASDIFVGTQDTGVFRSSDNGATWTEINTGLT